MSRIGKKPIPIPDGVQVKIEGNHVSIAGKLGKLERAFRPETPVALSKDGKLVVVSRINESRQVRAYHGLTRALIKGMIDGVTQGFEKKLEIVGVGYLAAVQGTCLQLRVGFANEVQKPIPQGLEVSCPDQTHIVVKGCDKQLVGQFAAEVRATRKPEAYKGKGIRYDGEYVKIKPVKAAT
jgi:large subunit ribosomal protein L6